MSALTKQSGGSHYKNLAIQPVEYIHANGIGYMEGNVIKYVTRWRQKGGVADLEKAKHYIDLLIELEMGKEAVDASKPHELEDGWIEWNKNSHSVLAHQRVEVKFEDGTVDVGFAGEYCGPYSPFRQLKIVAYRLCEEKKEANTPKPAELGDGWIQWDGGDCPVPAGTRVDIRFRRGGDEMNRIAEDLDWVHGKLGWWWDIVAYRIVE